MHQKKTMSCQASQQPTENRSGLLMLWFGNNSRSGDGRSSGSDVRHLLGYEARRMTLQAIMTLDLQDHSPGDCSVCETPYARRFDGVCVDCKWPKCRVCNSNLLHNGRVEGFVLSCHSRLGCSDAKMGSSGLLIYPDDD